MKKEWMFPPSKYVAYKLAYHQRQNNIPIIYVKIDRSKDNISCLKNVSNIFPFFMDDTKFASINHNGISYIRKQYPLQSCSAMTTIKF